MDNSFSYLAATFKYIADGVRNSAGIEAQRGIRLGALDHSFVSETMLRTSSNDGVCHAVRCGYFARRNRAIQWMPSLAVRCVMGQGAGRIQTRVWSSNGKGGIVHVDCCSVL